MLIATHKDVTQGRKLNVQHLLQDNIQFLCTNKHAYEEKRRSNDELFEEDLGSEVDKVFRSRKIANKVSKNFRSGGQRHPPPRFGQRGSNLSRSRAPPRGRGGVQKRGRGQASRTQSR